MAKKRSRVRKGQAGQEFDATHPWNRPRGPGGHFAKASSLDAAGGARIPVGPGSLGGQAGVAGESILGVEQATLEVATEPFVELGATGLRHYSGIIDEEFLPALRGRRRMAVYQEMRDNDSTVGAMLFAVEMLMRGVDWRVEPASESPQDLQAAQFVEEALGDMAETWEDTLASIFSFLPFGFSVHELIYKRRDGPDPLNDEVSSKFNDGRIGWSKLPVRAQDTINRWIFEPNTDRLLGLVQLPPPTFTPRTIPLPKLLHFRTTASKGNPEGRAILRNAYRSWFFKKRIEEIEGVGIERDLAGLPMMKVPAEILHANAPPELKALYAEIRKMLQDVRRDEREGVVIPNEYDKEGKPRYEFSLLSTGGRRQFDTTKVINRYDRAIASVVLADFIFLGQQGVGSLALGQSRTELFGLALGAWLDSVAAQFNRKGIPLLLAVNGLPTDDPPVLKHGDVETVDLAELAAYVSSIAGTGISFDDEETENFLRMQGGLPQRPEEDDAEKEARLEREAEAAARLELQAREDEDAAIAEAEELARRGGGPVPPTPPPGGPPPAAP